MRPTEESTSAPLIQHTQSGTTDTTPRHLTAQEWWNLVVQVPQFNRPSVFAVLPPSEEEDRPPDTRLAGLLEECEDGETDYPDDRNEAQEHAEVTAALYRAQLRVIGRQDD